MISLSENFGSSSEMQKFGYVIMNTILAFYVVWIVVMHAC